MSDTQLLAMWCGFTALGWLAVVILAITIFWGEKEPTKHVPEIIALVVAIAFLTTKTLMAVLGDLYL